MYVVAKVRGRRGGHIEYKRGKRLVTGKAVRVGIMPTSANSKWLGVG